MQATNGINTDPVAPGCGYCLQHLPSGKYLAVESGAASPANAAAGGGGGGGGAGFPCRLPSP